jgi:hypothetical protein
MSLNHACLLIIHPQQSFILAHIQQNTDITNCVNIEQNQAEHNTLKCLIIRNNQFSKICSNSATANNENTNSNCCTIIEGTFIAEHKKVNDNRSIIRQTFLMEVVLVYQSKLLSTATLEHRMTNYIVQIVRAFRGLTMKLKSTQDFIDHGFDFDLRGKYYVCNDNKPKNIQCLINYFDNYFHSSKEYGLNYFEDGKKRKHFVQGLIIRAQNHFPFAMQKQNKNVDNVNLSATQSQSQSLPYIRTV